MVPKVEGAWDIHYVDRLLAQLEAKAGLERPILVHAILETGMGVVNLEEIATASPRMQGMSFGPADLAASRRMKTTRVGGGHPGYLVIADPDPDDPEAPRAKAQQDLWHYSIARMVDACTSAGILPFYGPFGDIKDLDGCEAQFRAAFLMGCVGAWSLHPAQIDVAKKVFSPDPEEVKFAKKVIEAIPDGARRAHDRRKDAGRRHLEAVQGDGGAGRAAGGEGSRAGGGVRALARWRGSPPSRSSSASSRSTTRTSGRTRRTRSRWPSGRSRHARLFGLEANGTLYELVLWPLVRLSDRAELMRAPAVAAGIAACPPPGGQGASCCPSARA